MNPIRPAAVALGVLLAGLLPAAAGPPGGPFRVLDEEGRPVAGAWLSCGGPAPRGDVVATAGADGVLPAGSSCGETPAWVGGPGFLPVRLAGPTASPVRLRRGAVLRGRVTGADGAPLPGAVVTVRDRLREQRLLAGKGGTFTAGGLARGAVRVRAVAPGHVGTEVSAVVAGVETPPLDVVLPRPATLRVAGPPRPAGAGPLRVRVHAPGKGRPTWRGKDGPLLPREEELPPPGGVVPGILPAGEPLVLEALIPGCAPVRRDLLLRPGENEIALPCHRGTVVGRVDPPDPGERPGTITVGVRSLEPGTADLLAWAGSPLAAVDRDGRFRVGPLPPGTYQLLVRAPAAWLPGSPRVVVGETGSADAGTLRLRRGLLLAGRVLAGDDPAAGAEVRVAAEDRGRRWGPAATTDREGRFRLAVPDPGPWLLRARVPGRAPALARGVRAPREDVVLRTGAGATLRFALADPDGLPVPAARVLLLSPGGGRLLGAYPVRGDAEGRFVVRGIPPGERTVRVLAPGFAPVTVPRVSFREEETADLGGLVAGRGRVLAGTVLDPDGNPVAGALLRPLSWSEEGAAFDGRTGADGRFRVPGAPRDAFDLLVTAPGFAPLRVQVPAGGPGSADAGAGDELELRLRRGARVTCRVETAAGEPVPGALLEVSGYPGLFGERTGTDGRAVLRHVPPGRVVLQAVLDPDEPAAGRISREILLPEGGEREVVFRAGAGIVGIVTRDGVPVPAARVIAHRATGEGETAAAWTDDEGRFRLEVSRPGTWSLSVRAGPCRYHRPVTIDRGTAEVEIALPPVDLAGRVIDAADERPLPGILVAWRGGLGGVQGIMNYDLAGDGWESIPWDTLPGALAVADGEGNWTLCVPSSGPFELSAEGDDDHLPWSRHVEEEPPPSPLVIPLERRPAQLRIRVRLADGSAPAGNVGLIVHERRGFESVTFLPPSGEREMPMPRGPFRAWAVVRGYGLARSGWLDPARGDVPREGLELTVERGGWLHVTLAPDLAARVDPSRFRLHLYDDEGNDLFARVSQVGAVVTRPGDAPGEVYLGMFPRGTWRLAWEAGDERGEKTAIVDETPPLVVLGEK